MRVIVTGGAGFIGSALVRHLVLEKGYEVLNVDALTYAGNLASLELVEGKQNYRFLQADICNRSAMEKAVGEFRPDRIMHLAAESHVDRSITGAAEFIQTNVIGTFALLETAREYWTGLQHDQKDTFRFLHVSTDEVYGSLGDDGLFHEKRRTIRARPIRRPRLRPITSRRPGSGLMGYRSSSPTARTTMGRSTFPRS